MEIPHREVATANAANLAIANLMNKLKRPAATQKELNEAIIPVFWIRWGLNVIRRVGARLHRRILWSLRNSNLSDKDYNRVNQFWKEGDADTVEFPTEWEIWRTIIQRFNLDDELQLKVWVAIIDTCIKHGWEEPAQLALADAQSFHSFADKHALQEVSGKLWKATVLIHAEVSAVD